MFKYALLVSLGGGGGEEEEEVAEGEAIVLPRGSGLKRKHELSNLRTSASCF
jgi:uncharacterized protein YjlB